MATVKYFSYCSKAKLGVVGCVFSMCVDVCDNLSVVVSNFYSYSTPPDHATHLAPKLEHLPGQETPIGRAAQMTEDIQCWIPEGKPLSLGLNPAPSSQMMFSACRRASAEHP